MRHRRQQRHPAIETAVFAAALLLSAFIARELWSRRASFLPPPPVVTTGTTVIPAVLNPGRPPLPPGLGRSRSRTEVAVTGIAPIRLTRVQHRKPRIQTVPAPQ